MVMMDAFTSMSKLGLPQLLQAAPGNMSANGTSNGPPTLMDALLVSAGQASPPMQVLMFVYRLLGTHFGLDPSIILALLGFVWGMSKLLNQVYGMITTFASRYLMSSVYIGENDIIYNQMMKFLSEKKSIADNRFLMVQTVWRSAWEEEEDIANALLLAAVEDSEDEPRYLNFSSQAARSNPRYIPAMGTTGFWHSGVYFRVNRKKESFMNTSGWSAMKDLEEVRITCFGRSIEPLKNLLADAKLAYYHDTRQKTSIYRPRAKEQRREGGMWQQVARRPVRPMSTVVLDSKEKHDVLRDINEYLHPATPGWYASRGIPLRRGYLFHGPPGTGKTSFSFALAGVFGIDIYVISLQDATISEEELAVLFTRLPRRCIVLLEDIDTAGLRRAPDAESDDDEDDEKKKTKTAETNGTTGDKEKKKSTKEKKKKEVEFESDSDSDSSEDEKASRKRRKRKGSRKSKKSDGNVSNILTIETISLSGLLNAIDGVASHEGRILIMTTNKPESLDEALIRPGRVDVQVNFKNASSVQATELFQRMYEASRTAHQLQPQPQQIGVGLTPSAAAQQTEKQKMAVEKGMRLQRMLPGANNELDMTTEALRGISGEFGALIPDGVLSPAEIQGFLLKRKKTPRKALTDAPEWIEATRRQKELKSKVATVQ